MYEGTSSFYFCICKNHALTTKFNATGNCAGINRSSVGIVVTEVKEEILASLCPKCINLLARSAKSIQHRASFMVFLGYQP